MTEVLPYRVEYSKSNRAQCHVCRKIIKKDILRIAVIVQSPRHDGKWTKWHHENCFFKRYRPTTTGDIANFDSIRWDDQTYIKQKIVALEETDTNITSTSSAGSKHRNDRSVMSVNEACIKYNNEENTPPKAKKKKINREDFQKEKELKEQQEKLFSVRDDLSENLKKKELIEMLEANGQKVPAGKSEILDALADAILFGALQPCHICRGQLKFKSGAGYKCSGNVSPWAMCENIAKDPSRKKFYIPEHLKENYPFLERFEPEVQRRLIKITTPSTSSMDQADRKATVSDSYSCSSDVHVEKNSGNLRFRVKAGTVIDPDSDLEHVAHVYQRGNDKFTVLLVNTDVQTKENSYYKLQILKHDKEEKYWLFRSWGRIGTTIGDKKCESMALEECIEQFENLYEEKSGNAWSNRDNFVKVPQKKYPIDIDHAEDANDIDFLNSSIESELEKPVQDLMKLIFDIDQMKKAILEYEIDMNKMPLGKISKNQIQQAYSVLSELLSLVKSGSQDKTKYIAASNKFYTLIPHIFGVREPTVIDTEKEIQTKSEMLESLLEMQIAYTLLYTETDRSKNPLDAYYKQLNTNIEVLDRESDEFKLIEKYAKNTHAPTHEKYKLIVEEVFIVKRDGEESRYEPYKQLPNRKLLWHGSRVTNFAGILSQGLRIAPPEAPVTGYMFGKGIYFADMVSKSANYCCTNSLNSTGLLLLCDVALGNMYERYNADYIEKLPHGYHSTWGRGITQPNPEKSVKLKTGVEVPCGPHIAADIKHKSSLLYNEFIVYDVAQIKFQYLVKMNFEYNSTPNIFDGNPLSQNSMFGGTQFVQSTLPASTFTSSQSTTNTFAGNSVMLNSTFGGPPIFISTIAPSMNTITSQLLPTTSVSGGVGSTSTVIGLPAVQAAPATSASSTTIQPPPTAKVFGSGGSTSTVIGLPAVQVAPATSASSIAIQPPPTANILGDGGI